MDLREAAKQALLHYMEWYSEDRYAAAWHRDLTARVQENPDADCQAMRVLALVAGGWWSDDSDTFVRFEDAPSR
jgi:ribosomal 50S subunit-associated protein YjgA (DUF615 family)